MIYVQIIAGVLIHLLIYTSFGLLLFKLLKKENIDSLPVCLIGFILYYALFQLINLPLVLSFQTLKTNTLIWSIFCIASFTLSIIFCKEKWIFLYFSLLNTIKKMSILGWVSIGTITLLIVLCTANNYNDYDDAYYIGNINTSLETNTMYLYNPLTGDKLQWLFLRYALSSYMMANAVICQVLHLPAIIIMKVVLPLVFIVLSSMIYYKIAKIFFQEDAYAPYLFLIFLTLLNIFGNYSIYSSSRFYLLRTAQGKSITSSIILPFMFYIYIRLFKEHKDIFYWVLLFFISIAAASITLTATFLFALSMCAFAIVLCITKKDWNVLPKSFLCIAPSFAFFIIFWLFNTQKLVIETAGLI